MKIRRATANDIEEVRTAIRGAADEVGRPETESVVFALFLTGLQDGQLIPLLVARDGSVQGFCVWVRLPGSTDGRVEGGGTWVAEPYRMCGWSEKMRAEALRYQRQTGGKYVVGEANANDIAACRSVEKMGFKPERILYRLEVR